MAAKSWIGTGVAAWSNAANWSPSGVPAAADTVTLPALASAYTVTVAAADVISISTLTITGGTGAATAKLSMASGGSFTISGALTLTNANSILVGAGALTANGGISGGGVIEATGGTLTVVGAYTGGTLNLVVGAGAGDSLYLNNMSGIDVVSSLKFLGTSGSLHLGTIDTITVNSAVIFGSNTLLIDGVGVGFTDTAGVSIAGGVISGTASVSGTTPITGYGAISEPVVTGTAAITATGGTLNITGTVAARPLAIGAGATDKMLLGAASTASSVTFASATGAGTLEVGASGTLTDNSALAIGTNTVKLDAAGTAQLTDTAGVTIAGGALTGTGSIAAATALTGSGTVTAPIIAGTGAITASGGTLDLVGTVGSRPLAISSASPSDLKIDGTATSSAAISLTSANQTLEVGAAGNLTITGAETVSGGATLKMDGGTLTDTSGLILGAGSSLTGFGIIGATTPVTGTGSVTAIGGTLEFKGAVDTTTLTNFNVALGGDLKFDAAVGSGANAPVVTFAGGSGTLDLTGESALSNFDASVANFQTGDILLVAGAAGGSVTLTGGNLLTVYNSSHVAIGTITLAGSYVGSNFFVSPTGQITTNASCFMAGARIATPGGEAAVEALAIGDLVLTADGRVKPVMWLGKQTISSVFADPDRVWPIRVRAGALGENVPARDLVLSPDHALFIDGALVQAGALVNGSSVTRETEVPTVFVYYHVELDDHSLILAEGAPAETFVDNVDRLGFDNWDEHAALYPDGQAIAELPYPRAKSRRQIPVATRVKLGERAEAIGAALAKAA